LSAYASRPVATTPVNCPACGHELDAHHRSWGCMETHPATAWCQCQWSPNDIAYQLVYGGLTPLRSVATMEPSDV
jgi:hypothetical protein